MYRSAIMITICILAGSAFAATDPAQFTFIADTIAWNKSNYDLPVQQGPTNWLEPINYARGKVYARYEVLEKPSNRKVTTQLCMWQDGYTLESCSNCTTYTGTGVYYIDWGSPLHWWRLKALDYTRKFQQVYLMHKHDHCSSMLLMTDACGNHCYKGDDIDKHVPIVFAIEVIVVAKDEEFVPPTHWEENPWTR